MPKDSKRRKDHLLATGCGCGPSILTDMIEKAGLELSRRDFVRGVIAAGGFLTLGGLTSTVTSCKKVDTDDTSADTIYYGGPILTMVKDGDRVEALAVKDGQIQIVGSRLDVMASQGENTKLVNLDGKCLMPGFFDPHSHIVLQSVKFSVANLDPRLSSRLITTITKPFGNNHLHEFKKRWKYCFGFYPYRVTRRARRRPR